MYVKKLIDILSFSEKINAIKLLILVIIMAFFDVIGVASIMPFIALMVNPDLLKNNEYYGKILQFIIYISGSDKTELTVYKFGIVTFILFVLSIMLRALVVYYQTTFGFLCESGLAKRLFGVYLNQPYSWYLNKNGAHLGKNILSEVNIVVGDVIFPMMIIASQGSIAVTTIILLIIINAQVAFVVGAVLGVSYLLIYGLATKSLKSLGEGRFQANEDRYRIINEGFGGIKDVKVSGLEKKYADQFGKAALYYAKGQSLAQIISQLPRYGIELIAFGGMILLMLYLMGQYSDTSSVIPFVGLYAIAGYKLLPALQQIYGSLAQLKFAKTALSQLHQDMTKADFQEEKLDNSKSTNFTNRIEICNVSFKYPGANEFAIKNLNLSIDSCSKIGIIGASGSGKTTMIDLILGLLIPQNGVIKIDNDALVSQNIRDWQRYIGYVPQQIYLSDASIAENIAFGLDLENIDMSRVSEVAKMAKIYEFIINELPDGFYTKVGERGIRLSGGQRQRIGIARALYKKPKLLVMDEGTSALDNLTEKSVMNDVYQFGKEMTIIMIAHRLSTLEHCDFIYEVSHGVIVRTDRPFKMQNGI
jgi:ABC-type multidrug transport system fused ATPase/permease subunit